VIDDLEVLESENAWKSEGRTESNMYRYSFYVPSFSLFLSLCWLIGN
jgi:hypothetical protein